MVKLSQQAAQARLVVPQLVVLHKEMARQLAIRGVRLTRAMVRLQRAMARRMVVLLKEMVPQLATKQRPATVMAEQVLTLLRRAARATTGTSDPSRCSSHNLFLLASVATALSKATRATCWRRSTLNHASIRMNISCILRKHCIHYRA